METLDRYLSEHAFFKGLDEGYIRWLASCASNVKFDAGQYIFREGDEADKFFAIRHGTVALEIFAPGKAQDAITIQTVGEGEILGWSWLVPPHKKQFSARVVELTRMLAFDADCLRAKCEEDPKLGYEIFKRFTQILGQRLQATRLQLLDIYASRG
jgi:CRP-like cAMP-binding protein